MCSTVILGTFIYLWEIVWNRFVTHQQKDKYEYLTFLRYRCQMLKANLDALFHSGSSDGTSEWQSGHGSPENLTRRDLPSRDFSNDDYKKKIFKCRREDGTFLLHAGSSYSLPTKILILDPPLWEEDALQSIFHRCFHFISSFVCCEAFSSIFFFFSWLGKRGG